MTEPRTGYEFLKLLAEKRDNERLSLHEFYDYLEPKAREQGVPMHGSFELTPLCNFNCKMCYVHLTKEQMRERSLLTTDQWKEIMRQASEAGMIRATLSGGECLSYPGFKELFLFLHSLGCEVSIITNASLINKEWVQFFKDHMPSIIQITLYGSNDDEYEKVTGLRCFRQVMENIRILQEAELPVRITVTPNKYIGQEGVFNTIRLGRNITKACFVNSSLMTPREETGRSEGEHDLDIDFYVRLHHFMGEMNGNEPHKVVEGTLPPIGGPKHECTKCGLECGGGRSSFCVDWKGVMHPCQSLLCVESYPLRDGFRKAWEKINQAAESWPRVPECEGCAYAPVCKRCAAQMLMYETPGKQPLALCEQTKYFVQHGAWRLSDCE